MEIILGKTAGFCNGITRAVEGCLEQLNDNKKIYCLGEIAHNKQVVTDLKEKGIKFIDSLEEIKEENCKLLIRAHGVKKEIYEIVKNKNIELIDYTCPKVLAIHNLAENYAKKGYYIFLTGEKGHPEIEGTLSFCGKNKFLIETIEDVNFALDAFKKSGIKKLLLISQTTFHIEKFQEIQSEITKLISKEINFEVHNTICLATKVRQTETEEIASHVDKMIIIGGKKSSNTQKLYQISLSHCQDVIWIETIKELKNMPMNSNQKIGIMAGASTPKKSIDEVILYLNSFSN